MTVDEYLETLTWAWQRRLKLIFAKYDFHPTTIVIVSPVPYEEVKLWCNDNVQGKFHGWSEKHWFFDNPNDAMLFKLTWA